MRDVLFLTVQFLRNSHDQPCVLIESVELFDQLCVLLLTRNQNEGGGLAIFANIGIDHKQSVFNCEFEKLSVSLPNR